MNLFFPKSNRVSRKPFWMAQIAYLVILAVATGICASLNQATEPGQFAVSGSALVVCALVYGLSTVFVLASTVSVAVKRFHDRGKSGVWMLIMFVPVVGSLWYFVETGFLAGTPGPNRFGPSPRANGEVAPAMGYSTAL